jgi:cleavage and polyadenylation specificity factor subunit 1
MILFGKSARNMEVMAVDILPDGKDLYIVVADADCNLHIMQYDPEGMSRLLPSSHSFHH